MPPISSPHWREVTPFDELLGCTLEEIDAHIAEFNKIDPVFKGRGASKNRALYTETLLKLYVTRTAIEKRLNSAAQREKNRALILQYGA